MKIRQAFLLNPKTLLPALALTAGMMIWGGTLSAQTSPPDTQAPAQSTQQPQPDTPPAQQTPQAQKPNQAPDQTTPGQNAPAPTDGAKPDTGTATATDAQAFTGTVVKSGDKYVLQEDGGTTYDIDHQDDVKKFEGKRVKVHGTLDATGKKIMVQ